MVLGLAVAVMAAAPSGRQPVKLAPQPGTPLDRTARELVAQDLAEAARAGERPLVLLGTAQLAGPKERPALFVQLQSARECGSAGCSTAAYQFTAGKWQLVLDAVSGPVAVDRAVHRGMHDLIVHDNDRWVWNGTAYTDARGPPRGRR